MKAKALTPNETGLLEYLEDIIGTDPSNHLRLASNWLAVGTPQKSMPNYGKLSTRHFSLPNPFR
jgi:hypothetical protein